MDYWVSFQSTSDASSRRRVVNMLHALSVGVIDEPVTPESRHEALPVVTFGSDPRQLVVSRNTAPCCWVAILPEDEGSTRAFAAAGATKVLRMPVERSILISALARCFAERQALPGASP